MSFGLPSVKTKPIHNEELQMAENEYGVPNVLTHGITNIKTKIENPHPLEKTLVNNAKQQEQMNMTILRNIQGLHAPMRIAMELKAVNKTGHFPFLPSYNILRESLTGEDMEISFKDIYNTGEFIEEMYQPHAIVEKNLHIL